MKLTLIALSLCFSIFVSAAEGPVATTASEVRPLMVGAMVPDLTLTDPEGGPVRLREAAAEQPLVLVFYRGSWCPYCQKQLGALEKELGNWQESGFQIYAVAQDTPEVNAGVMAKQKLSFPVLADEGLEVARAFGLVFGVDGETVKTYKQYGIDLVGLYGKQAPEMPVPAVYLIGSDGKVLFHFVNPDYRVRLEPSVLKAAMTAYN